MVEWDEITARIEEARADSVGRCVAVFDADGTLWGEDLGERHLKVMEAREAELKHGRCAMVRLHPVKLSRVASQA